MHNILITASEKCLGMRNFSEKRTSLGETGLFIPTCQEDGTFALVQCHKDTKFCWCSTPVGSGIAGTSLQNGTPNCTKYLGKHLYNFLHERIS